ncbi:DUF2238 domain-containing protein [Metasolibacillus meyeri]|uniref:DUF2238 domain-containing protein n=1 Tax=Metasolibacillus meyeri TaxID=1071052 RepID=UPI000D3196BD|nr:DUF2238 domain-containing protein [Metasolibacillus meyeri]
MNKIHSTLFIVVVIVLLWSAIGPASYTSWLAEVGPAVVIMIILLITYSKFRFTTLSYCIIAFLSILTFIGGHYTYAEVPFFNWLKEEFHLQRNHYDRFGHFFKGLIAIVVREILLHFTPLKQGAWLSTISVSMVLAVAALYEIIEWLSTKVATQSKISKDVLGMQGDKWDAQWDMTLAFLGAVLATLLLSRLHNRILQKRNRIK